MFPFVSYETFLQEYQQKEALHLEKLPSAATALLAAKLQETSDVIVITSGQNEEDFLQNLSALLPEEPLHLPAWETLIGEDISQDSASHSDDSAGAFRELLSGRVFRSVRQARPREGYQAAPEARDLLSECRRVHG